MSKKLIYLFLGFTSAIIAQQKDQECLSKKQALAIAINQNKTTDAYIIWKDVFKTCPNPSEAFFVDGEKLAYQSLEIARTKEENVMIYKDLIQIYTQYNLNYPSNSKGSNIKKALLLFNQKWDTDDVVFDILHREFVKNKADFQNPEALSIYFLLLEKQYQLANKKVSLHQLMSKKIEIAALIADKLAALKADNNIGLDNSSTIQSEHYKQKIDTNNQLIASFQTVVEGNNALMAPYETNENIQNFAQAAFESHQNDSFWLFEMAQLMFEKNCVNTPFFNKIATQSEALNHNSISAKIMSYTYLMQSNVPLTTQWIDTAVSRSSDPQERALLYYQLATTVFGTSDFEKAAQYLEKALIENPKLAKAYLYMAQLYESGNCGSNNFEKKATYWLMASVVEKAGEVDANYKQTARIIADKYLKKAPNRAEIMDSGKAGKDLQLHCWINKTIKVPKT